MKKVENECLGCTDLKLHCFGASCPYKDVPRFYCDRCGEEEVLYDYYGEEICKECLLKEFNIVDGSDRW